MCCSVRSLDEAHSCTLGAEDRLLASLKGLPEEGCKCVLTPALRAGRTKIGGLGTGSGEKLVADLGHQVFSKFS